MRNHLRVVGSTPDLDLVRVVEGLLEDVKAGKTVGLAFIALHLGTDYSAEVLGEVIDHPLLMVGICRELEEAVRTASRKP